MGLRDVKSIEQPLLSTLTISSSPSLYLLSLEISWPIVSDNLSACEQGSHGEQASQATLYMHYIMSTKINSSKIELNKIFLGWLWKVKWQIFVHSCRHCILMFLPFANNYRSFLLSWDHKSLSSRANTLQCLSHAILEFLFLIAS